MKMDFLIQKVVNRKSWKKDIKVKSQDKNSKWPPAFFLTNITTNKWFV